ncbi:MAG: aspartate carbamoyltransferase catalytic subunit [Peptococcaceae bacterium]|nr:aspartate carbamoyltransferase catalytic subunit [Peptococcaceae bacterium]
MAVIKKDLLGLEGVGQDELTEILDLAVSMKEVMGRQIKKVPALRGKTVVNMFYEPSTRTRVSFELAAKYLSADTVNIAASTSSAVKGESMRDTATTLEALGADLVVLRHPMAGAPHLLAKVGNFGVLNAGDGFHGHPTQGLLDMFTIREKKGYLKGLEVAIVGDLLHSRVARSNIWGLITMGASVRVCAPPTMLPIGLERTGVKVFNNMDVAVEGADIVMMLRMQLERQQQGLFPSIREYNRLFGLNKERLALAAKDAMVMHPGPMNRGVEISPDVADGVQSVINDQVTNGVAVRMAVLYLLAGGGSSEVDN